MKCETHYPSSGHWYGPVCSITKSGTIKAIYLLRFDCSCGCSQCKTCIDWWGRDFIINVLNLPLLIIFCYNIIIMIIDDKQLIRNTHILKSYDSVICFYQINKDVGLYEKFESQKFFQYTYDLHKYAEFDKLIKTTKFDYVVIKK